MTNPIEGATIVSEGHTLGLVRYVGKFPMIDVLHASIIKGASSGGPLVGMVALGSKWRYATTQDFSIFNVKYHPDYKIVR